MKIKTIPEAEFEKLPADEQYEYLMGLHAGFWHNAVDQMIAAMRDASALPRSIALVAKIQHPDGDEQLAFETFEEDPGQASDAMIRASISNELVEHTGLEEKTAMGIAMRATYMPLAMLPDEKDIEIIKALGGQPNVKH